jgi:hypothetical protein
MIVRRNSTIVFLTNDFNIGAQTVADLYRYRWQIELFFKWIKQHLKIKTFWGRSENAVKTHICIAICAYLSPLPQITSSPWSYRIVPFTMEDITLDV